MPRPGSRCSACGGSTRLRHPGRGPRGSPPPDEVRCTSPYLSQYEAIWACRVCGLAYQAADDDPSGLADAYADVADPLYLAEEHRRREEFRELLGRLEDFQRPERLLEVGSYAGLCLDEARPRGWVPVGLEPSRWAAKHARDAYGAEIVNGTLADAPWGPESFDAVCMWDVLEHLPDPLADLRRCAELLKPGAALALTTVNIAAPAARLLGPRWPWLMRMHLYYFTPASLRILLARAGLQTVVIEPHPKRFRLRYVLERAGQYAPGPVAAARRLTDRWGLDERVVSIRLGDIVLAVARKPDPDGEEAARRPPPHIHSS